MYKKILVIVFLFSVTIQSQNVVKGKLVPQKSYEWIVLYQLKGAKQIYIANTKIKDGSFLINMPSTASNGMYRLMYEMGGNNFIDFIYNNESIELQFNPENLQETLQFLTSEENKIYTKYLRANSTIQHKIDSLQLGYFNLKTQKEKEEVAKKYKEAILKKDSIQSYYEKKSEGKLANHFIHAGKIYSAPEIIATAQEYLNAEKLHYFDSLNMEDQVLLNSTFLTERIMDYVFYLNVSDDVEVQDALYKKAIQEVLQKVIQNISYRSELIATFLYVFSQQENAVVTNYLIENYYSKLPQEYISQEVISQAKENIKLAIGNTAPEITWEEEGVTQTLSKINKADTYILVFWSTGCSHCLNEIPKLYEYTKDNKEVHVIAVALEEDDKAFNNYAKIHVNWSNVLALNKWQNPVVKQYKIKATPTYFILDKNKKIIAKPDHIEDVKKFFEH